ncbi:MAG: autotransporter-associated beta strand repeat-containing protein [Opitutaceae bacterium]|jgi:fibronectin-binding autotransporter adhesin|nr:autotransporter-associated beta strand repeat-containing protein [Opitutaceae bacterium]
MKVTSSRRSLSILLGSALAASGAAELSAQNITWRNTAGQTTWSDGNSWTGGTAPADSLTTNTAIFTAVSNAQPVLTANRSVNGIDFQLTTGGATFSSSPGATLTVGANGIDATTQLSGTSTVSVENITVGAASTWTLFSNTNTASTSTFTISSNLNLNGQNLIISPNRSSSTGNLGIVNLTGVISGSPGASGLQLYAGGIGRNRIFLTNANSYTGLTQIRTAEVYANTLANAGTNSSLGAGGDIVVGNNASGASLVFQDLAADSTTNRRIQFRGTATSVYTLTNNSTLGRVAFTNADDIGTPTGVTTNVLGLRFNGTNTGLNTFGQPIVDRANSGITSVTKEQSGTWVLGGNNSYTGATTVSAGSLFINGDQTSATGAVNVNGTSTLGGSGTIGGAVTLNATSRLAPGANGIGQLTLKNGLNVNVDSGGSLRFEVGGSGGVKGVDFDSLVVSAGAVSLGSNAALIITAANGFDFAQVGAYDLYDFASAATGNFASVNVGGTDFVNDSGIWTGSIGAYDYTFVTSTGVLSAVSAIPEPSSFALLAGFAALGGVTLRRRRR